MDDPSAAPGGASQHTPQDLAATVAELERQLAEARAQIGSYEELARAAGCGLFVAVQPDSFAYVNDEAARLTGYSVAELQALGAAGLSHPSERERLLANYHTRLEGGEVASPYEALLLHKDGHPVPVELSGTLINWQGQPANMVLVHDLTDAYRTRDRLRRINTALHGVLTITDALIVCPDTDSLLRRSVELARSYLGLERCSIHLVDGELMRGTYGTSMTGETTDERSHSYPAGDYWANIRDTLPLGRRWLHLDQPYREWRGGDMTTIAGEGITIATAIHAESEALGVFYNDNAITGQPLDSDIQDVVALFCSLLGGMLQHQRAREALRESESRFRQMAELLPDIVFETDAKLRLTYVNQSGFDAMGYTREDMARQLRITDFVLPDQAMLVRRRLDDIARGGETGPAQYYLRRADGSLLPVEVRTAPRFGPDGEFLGYRGVVRDIAERQRIEHAQRMAAVGELAASMAHDFGNILASMQAWALTARKLGDGETLEGLVDAVLHGCERGGALCRNLMHLTTPPALRREPVALEAPIESALAMAAPELERRHIEVTRRYNGSADGAGSSGCVLADPAQLEQVFLNLIINACHAMPEGGRLLVETEHVPEDAAAGTLRARVSDSGTGIPAANLERIFEPFFSTRNGDDGSGGHGLGLSVSYGIVNGHGGTLTVRSEVGVGSSFEVNLAAHAGT